MLNNRNRRVILLGLILLCWNGSVLAQSKKFPWPKGKKMAISLSFDDARPIQLKNALPILDNYGVKATFFLTASNIEGHLQGWKAAVKDGQEMGNHTFDHPCGGSKNGRLENMTLQDMRWELLKANRKIRKLLGVTPKVFANPCGQSYVGKGIYTKSYVPLVAKYFLVGRDWLSEVPENPQYCNLSQLAGLTMGDEKTFKDLLPILKTAAKKGQWVVFVGHDVGGQYGKLDYLGRHLNTLKSTLRKLCEYATDSDNDIWIAPIGTIARYVKKTRNEIYEGE